MLGMKVACNATLWLIILGGSIVISSFFSKTHRINKIVRSSKLCKRVKVSERDVMVPIIVLIARKCNFWNMYSAATLIRQIYSQKFSINDPILIRFSF